MERIVGIDLGTTNSVIAIMEQDEPKVIPNNRGEKLTPSIVAFSKFNEVLVGKVAKNQAVVNAEKTVQAIKRKMGSRSIIKIGDKSYTPQEISSYILQHLKEDVEEYLGEKVDTAVITVPAYFNDKQRKATLQAGELAGLKVKKLINEPTAAAIAYGLNQNNDEIVLVYDLGGGTFDISIMKIKDQVFEVLATCGNNLLGGNDFDRRLLNYVIKTFKEKENIDLSKDIIAYQKILEEVEKTKVDLSTVISTQINIPFITADENGPKHIQLDITREIFENLILDLIEETLETTLSAIDEADIKTEDINKVILVGGSTRIPLVQKEIEKIFPNKIVKGINPEEVVSAGSAIQAGFISGTKKGIVLLDAVPISLGVELDDGSFLPIISKNTTYPLSVTKTFTTSEDDQDSVEIHILQGEDSKSDKNISLAKIKLKDIPPQEKGVPKIEVQFNINADGILEVQAKETSSNQSQTIKIVSSGDGIWHTADHDQTQDTLDEDDNFIIKVHSIH